MTQYQDWQNEAIEASIKPIQSQLDEMKALCESQNQYNVQTYFDLGKIIGDPRVVSVGTDLTIQRVNLYDVLAELTGRDVRYLHGARMFAAKFSEAQLIKLIEAKVPVTHVRHLVAVSDDSNRDRLIDAVIEQGWTVEELRDAKREVQGNKRPGSGRPRKVPKDLASGLSSFIKTTESAKNIFEQTLFCEAFDLPSEICSEPPDDLTEEMRDRVQHGIDLLRALVDLEQDYIERLAGALQRFDEVFTERERRQQQEAPV